jgi:hypothetical protein
VIPPLPPEVRDELRRCWRAILMRVAEQWMAEQAQAR